MQPRMIKLHSKTRKKLILSKKKAEHAGEYRVAKRIHAVLLSHQQKTSGEIAKILNAPRSKVSEWLKYYQQHGFDALLEGQRCGRPSSLSEKQYIHLEDIIDSGPIAYGFTSAVWTSPMISEIIYQEYNVNYHPGHVRKLLHKLDYSVQRPKRILINADETQRNRWRRYTYPNIKKKPIARMPL